MSNFNKLILAIFFMQFINLHSSAQTLTGNIIASGHTKDTVHYEEHLIHTFNINFHFKDSLYLYTLFVEPDGRFYFEADFVESIPLIRATKDYVAKEVFKKITDSIIVIESLYPKLIAQDSSMINEHPFDFQYLPLIHELEYSFVLQKLNEPSLFACENKRAIRVIIPESGVKYPGRHTSIRVEFENGKAKLKYDKGDFDKAGNYQILENKTCTLSDKFRKQLETAIKEIKFENEYYFVKANNDPKYLIEYRDGDKYYAILRPLDQKGYSKLWTTLVSYSHRKTECNE